MNRFIKILFNLGLALVAVFLTLVVIFLLTPAWQKAVTEDLLARDSARRWQLDSIHIRPAWVEAQGIYVLEGPIGAEVRLIEMTGPLWKLPFTGTLDVESGRLSGLEADLSQLRVGDLTSEDYQTFLGRVSGDPDFWKERIGLVMSKISAAGLELKLRDVEITGRVTMPGGHVVPVRWRIVEADSTAPRLTRVEPLGKPQSLEL